MWSFRRWWRNLWRRAAPATTDPTAPAPRPAAAAAPAIDADGAAPVPPRRQYTVPSTPDDPQREARLGAVLEALRAGPLRRAELGARVGADGWGPGRLDAVVDHGVTAGVLLETGDGVRARYAD